MWVFLTTREVKVLDIGQEQSNMQNKLYATKLLDKYCLYFTFFLFGCDFIAIPLR